MLAGCRTEPADASAAVPLTGPDAQVPPEEGVGIPVGLSQGSTSIDLLAAAPTTVSLSNGDQVTFDPGVGDLAIITPEHEAGLPVAPPPGYAFVVALTVSVLRGGSAITTLSDGKAMALSFAPRAGFGDATLTVLYWDLTLDGGLGGWAELSAGNLVHAPDGGVQATVAFTGTFMLVAR